MINGFGMAAVGGYSAAVKLNNMTITSITAIGNGMSNYTAQNAGAGIPERIEAGLSAGIKLAGMIALVFAGLYLAAGPTFVGLFITDGNQAALSARRDVLAHRFAVLSGDRSEADRGWSAARSESDEAVYDGDVDGSGYPRCLRWSFLNGSGAGLNWNLAVLAGWLADRSHNVGVLLPCGEAAALRYPAGSDPAGNAGRRNGGGMDRK